MNWVKEYVSKIDSGEIKVSKKVDKIYHRLVKQMEDKSLLFYFDEEKGERPIIFIETFCKQAEGKLGAPIVLDLWQKAFLQALFGFLYKDTGYRRFKEALLLVGRKNGKTTLLAGIALYMLVADNEGSAEVYSIATKKDQASKCFKGAKDMVAQSPNIRTLIKKRRTDLYMPLTFSKFEPLASDSDSLDGLNSHLVIIDELHAIKDRNLYEVMYQSMGSRRQPILCMITTAGTLRENIFDDKYDYAKKVVEGQIEDDTFLPVMYELDKSDEWLDWTNWIKANPGLGTIKTWKYLTDIVQKAKNDPKELPGVLCKDFNIRSTGSEYWLTYEELNNEETFDLEDIRNSYCIGGVDLSATTDLTCATILIMKKDSKKVYILQQYFAPEENIENRAKADNIPYVQWKNTEQWKDSGINLLSTSQGSQVDYKDVTEWFVKMRNEYQLYPIWIKYDRALAGYWVDDMKSNGFQMEPCPQGALTFSAPMRMLEANLKDKLVNYNNNPILKWCISNVKVKSDDNENIRPIKGRNRRQRVDGLFSLLDAYVCLFEHLQEYENLI